MSHCYLPQVRQLILVTVLIMNHIPEQSLDPSQPLLHKQEPSIQEPLLLQSIPFSHGNGAEREKHIS